MGRSGLGGRKEEDEKVTGQEGCKKGNAVSMGGCAATVMGAETGQDTGTVLDSTETRLHAGTGQCAGEKFVLQVLITAAACRRVVRACMSMTRPVRSCR